MRHKIILLLFIQFMVIFPGCASKSPITSQEDALELLAQTDCHFMGIKVITMLPGTLKAQSEDKWGIYFYTDNFKNATYTNYTKAGIFIPKNGSSKPYAFAEKSSPDSLAILSCDTLNFTKTNTDDHSKTISQ